MSPPQVKVGPSGLALSGGPSGEQEHLPFLSGAMHYFRVPRRHWARCLDRFVELGLPLVESYVPWGVHERPGRRLDFGDGPVRDGFERDLAGFLDACAQRGLKVILRPGPHINAELTCFGFPERVLEDERCLARGALGNPVILPVPPRSFPVPSYASKQFLQEAGAWLRGFGDFVAPFCWPDGPLVAAQVDNEMALFFRTGAYDQDYHPDAIALYRRFLRRRYPDGLPAGYAKGTKVGEAEPPRRLEARAPEQLVVHLDWIAFKEWMVAWALDRLAKVLRMTGLEHLALLHNLPAVNWGDPASLCALERKLDLVGLDVYLRGKDYATARRAARLLAGSSRLPVVPELGCGGWPWWFPLTLQDQRTISLALLMHGVKGFNLYMLVERDRWYGAPVRSDGSRHGERFRFVEQLVRACQETALPTLERRVEVAVMRVRNYERLGLCTSLLDPLPPAALDLLGLSKVEVCSDESYGLSGPIAPQYGQVLEHVEQLLERLQVPFHLVESDLPAERLAAYKLLVVPCFDFLGQELLSRLNRYVEAGGTLLLTPRAPELDAQLRPLSDAPPPHVLAGTEHELEVALARQVEELGLEIAARATAGVDTALYVDVNGTGRARVLFVANPRPASCTTAIAIAVEGDAGSARAARIARDALTGTPVDLKRLHLEPFQVRMLTLGDGGGSG